LKTLKIFFIFSYKMDRLIIIIIVIVIVIIIIVVLVRIAEAPQGHVRTSKNQRAQMQDKGLHRFADGTYGVKPSGSSRTPDYRVAPNSVIPKSTIPTPSPGAGTSLKTRGGWTIPQVLAAFGLDGISGSASDGTLVGGRQVLAIIDFNVYKSPKTDLGHYLRSNFSTPDLKANATEIINNVTVHRMPGAVVDHRWDFEEALDLQIAATICPGAQIHLIQAGNQNIGQLKAAIDFAATSTTVGPGLTPGLGATVVVMPWSVDESMDRTSLDTYFSNYSNVVFVAPTGNTAGVVTWPSSSPDVVAVGGTDLTAITQGAPVQSAYVSSGGGTSAYETISSQQTTYLGGGNLDPRQTPDVSYPADPADGVIVYVDPNFYVVGGTSVAAMIFASMIVASNANNASNISQSGVQGLIYTGSNTGREQYTNNIFQDITTGTGAITGYDHVTGVGTPSGQFYTNSGA
jgi:hypothetical protein